MKIKLVKNAFYKKATGSMKLKLKQHRAHYVHQTTLQGPQPQRLRGWEGHGRLLSYCWECQVYALSGGASFC